MQTNEKVKKQDSLFMDKIEHSSQVRDKEGYLVGQFNQLRRKLRTKILSVEELEDSTTFNNCWRVALELYDFLEFNKFAEIGANPEYKEDFKVLKGIMKKADNYDVALTFEDLKTAYLILRKFISVAGYHDDTYKNKNDGTLLEEEW